MTVLSFSLTSQAVGYAPFKTAIRDPVSVDGHYDTTTVLCQIVDRSLSPPEFDYPLSHAESRPSPILVPTHPADALECLARDIFGCRGRDFGGPSRGVLGISHGNEGVQWNAGYRPGDGFVWLGANLEGMQYDDCRSRDSSSGNSPVSSF